MPPLGPISTNILQKKPGPKPKPLHERKAPSFKPVTRVERSYKQKKRVEVLLFLLNHRIPGTTGGRGGHYRQDLPPSQDGFRPPTLFEASQFFKIPEATIRTWWKKRDQLVRKEDQRRYHPRWPELEDKLYTCFLTRRTENRIVSIGWFRRESKRLFKDTYPESVHLWVFSTGWFRGFLHRHRISHRRVTKKATKLPAEYLEVVNNFVKFIRRISQPRDSLSVPVSAPASLAINPFESTMDQLNGSIVHSMHSIVNQNMNQSIHPKSRWIYVD